MIILYVNLYFIKNFKIKNFILKICIYMWIIFMKYTLYQISPVFYSKCFLEEFFRSLYMLIWFLLYKNHFYFLFKTRFSLTFFLYCYVCQLQFDRVNDWSRARDYIILGII